MFCPQCGKEVSPHTRFCSECGAPVSEPPPSAAPPQEGGPAPSAAPPPNQDGPYQQTPSVPPNQFEPSAPQKPRRSKKPLLLMIPAVAVALAVLTAFHFTALAARFAPDYALNRGFHKLSAALKQQQSEHDSMALLPVLSKYLQDGTFLFSGEWTDPNYGDAVIVSGTLLTDQDDRTFQLQDFTCSVSDVAMNPLSLYLSPEAFAIHSIDVTGEDGWYGLYLDRPVSEQIPDSLALSPLDIARLQAQVDSLTSLLNTKEDPTAKALAKELTQVLDDFLDRSRPSVSNESVRIVDSRINATVLTYHFTMPDLAVLADNFFDVLLKEEYVAYLAGRSSAGIEDILEMTGSSVPDEETWAAALEESRQEIVSALRTEAEGEVTLAFALASDGTLVKISTTAAKDDYGSKVSITCSFSMDPANGDFALVLETTSNGSSLLEASLTGTTADEPDAVNQTLAFHLNTPYGGETSFVLSSDWNPSDQNFSGSFTATVQDTVIALLTADGTLTIQKDTLDLNLDTIRLSIHTNYWDDEPTELMRGSFHLSAEEGSSITTPDFENIFQSERAEFLF